MKVIDRQRRVNVGRSTSRRIDRFTACANARSSCQRRRDVSASALCRKPVSENRVRFASKAL